MTWRDAELMFACRACGADVGEPCVTYRPLYLEPGRRAAFPHSDRWLQVRDVIRATGYEEMYDEYSRARWGMVGIVRGLRATIQSHIDRNYSTDPKWLAKQLDAILKKGDPNR